MHDKEKILKDTRILADYIAHAIDGFYDQQAIDAHFCKQCHETTIMGGISIVLSTFLVNNAESRKHAREALETITEMALKNYDKSKR